MSTESPYSHLLASYDGVIEQLFQKDVDLSADGCDNVCREVDLSSQLSELARLKAELNATKALLNDKDVAVWHEFTGRINPSGKIVRHMKDKYRPELCTQAFCKFYELLARFDLLPSSSTFRLTRCQILKIFCEKSNSIFLELFFSSRLQVI